MPPPASDEFPAKAPSVSSCETPLLTRSHQSRSGLWEIRPTSLTCGGLLNVLGWNYVKNPNYVDGGFAPHLCFFAGAVIDYAARVESVATLKKHIAQRDARFELVKKDLRALDELVENQTTPNRDALQKRNVNPVVTMRTSSKLKPYSPNHSQCFDRETAAPTDVFQGLAGP